MKSLFYHLARTAYFVSLMIKEYYISNKYVITGWPLTSVSDLCEHKLTTNKCPWFQFPINRSKYEVKLWKWSESEVLYQYILVTSCLQKFVIFSTPKIQSTQITVFLQQHKINYLIVFLLHWISCMETLLTREQSVTPVSYVDNRRYSYADISTSSNYVCCRSISYECILSVSGAIKALPLTAVFYASLRTRQILFPKSWTGCFLYPEIVIKRNCTGIIH